MLYLKQSCNFNSFEGIIYPCYHLMDILFVWFPGKSNSEPCSGSDIVWWQPPLSPALLSHQIISSKCCPLSPFCDWIGFMNFSSCKICIPHLLPTCNTWFRKQHLCVIMCEVIMCDSSLTKSKSFWRVAQCLSLFPPLVLKPRSAFQRSLGSLLLACLYNTLIY